MIFRGNPPCFCSRRCPFRLVKQREVKKGKGKSDVFVCRSCSAFVRCSTFGEHEILEEKIGASVNHRAARCERGLR